MFGRLLGDTAGAVVAATGEGERAERGARCAVTEAGQEGEGLLLGSGFRV